MRIKEKEKAQKKRWYVRDGAMIVGAAVLFFPLVVSGAVIVTVNYAAECLCNQR